MAIRMSGPCPGGRWARVRSLRLITAAAFAASSCVVHDWKSVPLTEVSVARESLPRRHVRAFTSGGWVDLDVTGVAFPYVEGRAEPGTGEVLFDLRNADQAVEIAGGLRRVFAGDLTKLDYSGKRVRFETEAGPVVLKVTSQGNGHVRGQPTPCTTGGSGQQACRGLVRVDLRETSRLEVRSFDALTSLAGTAVVTASVLGALVLIVLLTKESCPFVYVDSGRGLELVGEAYAGAAFRSLQRDDMLPLPVTSASPADGRYRVRLRNEARETQYTDRAELVVVDHLEAVRVLASFDGRLLAVAAPQTPRRARDLAGRDRLADVAARDGRIWQGDLERAAALGGPLREGVVAAFPAPRGPGRPVLELVAGNTAWLDLVFGRFFASMGTSLDRYLAAWNRPEVGPRLVAWKDREGVDLRVEVRSDAGWRAVATIPTVGPVALREIAVPLPVDSGRGGRPVEVRLSGGVGFWRLDSLRLSEEREPEPGLGLRRLKPATARGDDGADARAILATSDGRYHALERLDESLDLEFELPPRSAERRSLFFFSNGFYNVHPPLQGSDAPLTVQRIQQEPGALGRFSLDLAQRYAAIAASAPRLAAARP